MRASFARQGAMATIGAQLDEVAPGRVVVGLVHSPAISQQHGFVHAGMLAAAMDTACGYAASTLMPAEAGVLTIEYKINLLAPARGPRLRCEAEVTKAGRTISVAEARAWGQDAQGRPTLAATMTATLMTITGREGVKH